MGETVKRGRCSIERVAQLRRMVRRWRRKLSSVDVPAGYVAVCVGRSSRRFVVRAAHLNHQAFRELLERAEEEYGFPAKPGPLSLPCDESIFEDALRRIAASSSSQPSSSWFANLSYLRILRLRRCHVGRLQVDGPDNSPPLLRRFD